MKKIIIPIRGMHCKSCEMLIEEKLSQIQEVKKTNVSAAKGEAQIYYAAKEPNEKEIEEAIREAGYSVGSDDGKKYLLSSNPSDYKDLGIAFLFLFGLYLVLKNFGILDLSLGSSISNPSSLSVVLLVGLTAGLSTCMALVGGLILGISARHAEKHPEATPMQKFRPHIFFNLGRILSYAVLGGVLGALGSVFQFSSLTLGVITVLVGIVMLVMGLQLIEIFPILKGMKLALPKSISKILGIKNHQGEYSHKGSMILGGLTFFLPCGFTQAMQLFAISSGSFISGFLIMGIFALGTAPGLLGIGGVTSAVKGIFAKRFFKFAGLLVIIFSLFNISNGYNLTGLQLGNAKTSENITANDPNVTLENGVQIVKMTQKAGGYYPSKFTIKKGVPVKWVIDSEAPYSCASSIGIPKLNISKRLVSGENIIEFTPKEVGSLKFSCSMGMYTGAFNVVDENGQGEAVVADSNSIAKGGACNMGGGSSGGCARVAAEPNQSLQMKASLNRLAMSR